MPEEEISAAHNIVTQMNWDCLNLRMRTKSNLQAGYQTAKLRGDDYKLARLFSQLKRACQILN
jgi:hypothetical protein